MIDDSNWLGCLAISILILLVYLVFELFKFLGSY